MAARGTDNVVLKNLNKGGTTMTLDEILLGDIVTEAQVQSACAAAITATPVTVGVNNDKTGYSIDGASGGVGPTAAEATQDIYATAFKNGTVILRARVYKDGADITRANIATIAYSIYLLDGGDPDTRTVVTGHDDVSLTVANVIFDTLQSDSEASNYNFKHAIPISVNPAFTVAGRNYQAEYVITPTSGEIIIVRFRIEVQ